MVQYNNYNKRGNKNGSNWDRSLTIPATIRKKMKIKDGERFEISIDEEEEIISFKRSPINFNK